MRQWVRFFLMPANGRPCRSTGRGGTGIVNAPGKPCGTVTSIAAVSPEDGAWYRTRWDL